MKLCAHVEGARERLRDGSLTLDAAAQLHAAFERRDRERARAARRAGSGTVAAMRRNGSAPSAPALVLSPQRKPLRELDASARKALVDEAAGKSTRQVMQMLAEVDPELAVPADRVRALTGGRWELKVVIEVSAGMDDVERIPPEHPITPVIGVPDRGQLPDDFAVFRYPNVRVIGDRVFILYAREWFELARGAKSGFEDEGGSEVVLGREDVLRVYPLAYFYPQTGRAGTC